MSSHRPPGPYGPFPPQYPQQMYPSMPQPPLYSMPHGYQGFPVAGTPYFPQHTFPGPQQQQQQQQPQPQHHQYNPHFMVSQQPPGAQPAPQLPPQPPLSATGQAPPSAKKEKKSLTLAAPDGTVVLKTGSGSNSLLSTGPTAAAAAAPAPAAGPVAAVVADNKPAPGSPATARKLTLTAPNGAPVEANSPQKQPVAPQPALQPALQPQPTAQIAPQPLPPRSVSSPAQVKPWTPPPTLPSVPENPVVAVDAAAATAAESKAAESKHQETSQLPAPSQAPVASHAQASTANPAQVAPTTTKDDEDADEEEEDGETFSYDESGWNPITKTGEPRYSSKFLLQFRELVTKQPVDLDVNLCKTININKPLSQMGAAGRGKGQPARGPRKIKIGGSKVTLVRSENAWMPHSLSQSADADEAKVQRDKRRKQVSGDLNKLTLERFDTLSKGLFEILVAFENSEEDVLFFVNELLSRVQDQHNFSGIYARLCKFLIVDARTPDKKEPHPASKLFRLKLLSRCQEEFDRDNKRDKQEEVDAANGAAGKSEPAAPAAAAPAAAAAAATSEGPAAAAEGAAVKVLSPEDLELEKIKLKRHMLGRVRFIGELYKLSLVSAAIMFNDCLPRLIKLSDDELVVESLAELLTTAGKQLEQAEKAKLDPVFTQVKAIKDRKGLSSRVRFKLQDLIELRELKRWVDSTTQVGPQKISEIRQQAAAPPAPAAQGPRPSDADRDRGRGRGGQRFDDRDRRPSTGRGGHDRRGDDRRGGYGGGGGGGSGGGGRPFRSERDSQEFGKFSKPNDRYLGPQKGESKVRPVEKEPEPEPLPTEETKKAAEAIVKALSREDGSADDATQAVASMTQPLRVQIVTVVFEAAANVRQADFERLSAWLVSLVQSDLLKTTQFLDGIPVEELEDLVEDAPRIFEYLADVLAQLAGKELIALSVLTQPPLNGLDPFRLKKVAARLATKCTPAALAKLPPALLGEAATSAEKQDTIFEVLLRQNEAGLVAKAVEGARNKLAAGTSAMVAVIKAALAQPGAVAGDDARNHAVVEGIKAHAKLLEGCGAASVIQGLRVCDRELQHPAGFAKACLQSLYDNDALSEEGLEQWAASDREQDLFSADVAGLIEQLKQAP